MLQFLSFLLFTGFVAFYATWQLRKDKLNTQDGYFLGGRSLTGIVIAGSGVLKYSDDIHFDWRRACQIHVILRLGD